VAIINGGVVAIQGKKKVLSLLRNQNRQCSVHVAAARRSPYTDPAVGQSQSVGMQSVQNMPAMEGGKSSGKCIEKVCVRTLSNSSGSGLEVAG
jgi:hypothetical protein